MKRISGIAVSLAALVLVLVASGCGGTSSAANEDSGSGGSKVTLVAYSTPQEAYEEIIPAFQKTAEGKGVEFEQSYGASGEQSRAVEAGLPADVVEFSLDSDITRLVDAGLVDAIEVLNAKTSLASLNRRAAEFAADHGLLAGAGSDAHVPDALGSAYVEMPDFDGPSSFLEALAHARIAGHHWDRARPWRPRIVPSTSIG